MAVSETLELDTELRRVLDRPLETVIVNGVLPQRFTEAELAELERSTGGEATRAAAAAAHSVHVRAHSQRNQLERLRRRSFRVLRVPFVFARELDLAAIERIGGQLGEQL